MKITQPLLFVAWKKLIGAYVLSLAIGFLAGVLLVEIGNIKPESIYVLSTKRLSYALPVLDMGARHGIDNGISLFVWNSIGALITMSFIYTAALFDPAHIEYMEQFAKVELFDDAQAVEARIAKRDDVAGLLPLNEGVTIRLPS